MRVVGQGLGRGILIFSPVWDQIEWDMISLWKQTAIGKGRQSSQRHSE